MNYKSIEMWNKVKDWDELFGDEELDFDNVELEEDDYEEMKSIYIDDECYVWDKISNCYVRWDD